jgi:hypothetical protein
MHQEGKAMAVMDYRTQDGLADYGFSIEFHADVGWRVYIVFQSLYESCDDKMDSPYQATDRKGLRYVDWRSKLVSLGDARTVAGLWAELDHRYHTSKKGRRLQQPSSQAS